MNAAGNKTLEYGFDRAGNMGRNIIRGDHARQPHSSSPKRRECTLFVLKIKMASNVSFFKYKNFFGIIKHIIKLALRPREIS